MRYWVHLTCSFLTWSFLLVGGFRKRHDAACALKGKRAYLRRASSFSSSAPQQPAAAARKQASGVARGVGQIVFAGSWPYSLDLKKKLRDDGKRWKR